MKRNLLVTTADENYIDAAKQFFASAYFNSGWQGDYMLLSCGINEKKLQWFKDRGIFVKKCEPLAPVGYKNRWAASNINKIYLFQEEMKHWGKVLFFDADTIIRASLDGLLRVKSIVSTYPSLNRTKIREHIVK